MPIRHTDKGWYWGTKGPFATRVQAQKVATAAYASGYKEEQTMANITGEFIGNLLHSATITHFMHLSAQGEGSYAKHKALGNYYDEIVEVTDTLAEAIQGKTGELISGYPTMFANVTGEPLEYLKSLRNYVQDNREQLPLESNIQNEVDAITTLLDSTIYKLTFLR